MIVALHSTLREGAVAGYQREHARIPADLQAMFDRLGVQDWRIWRSGDRLFHLVECEDWERLLRESPTDPANIAWQAHINQFVCEFYDADGNPGFVPLERVWSLAEQRLSA